MNCILSILAIIIFIGCGVLISENRKAINWRTVIKALAIQELVIIFVLKVPLGQKLLEFVAKCFSKALSFGNSGLEFVFGTFSTNYYSFAINVLALICFTSSVISVLYYLGVIQFFVKIVGGAIAKLLGTTPAETFGAVGCSIFSGTEAPLLVKPFIKNMTRSELFTLVIGGFASASISVLSGYALMGVPMKYLLIAVVTVPFSTLLMAKIIVPETENSKLKEVTIQKSEDANIFEAIGSGGIQGMNTALAVGATLIAFLGFVALLDYLLAFLGTSFSDLLAIVFTPIAWLFHIPCDEVQSFASLIGIKTALNEFVAYTEMSPLIATMSPRTLAILSVALCNFSNFSVIGIMVGGFKSFAPERAEEVAGLGVKALIGGLLTTLITACLVALLF